MRSKEEWSATRVAAVLTQLDEAGYPQSQLARMAGVSQPTISRWRQGKVRPGHDAAQGLALATWRRHPVQARELVEASGYRWTEPPEPEPEPLVDPEVAAILRRRYPDDAAELIAELGRREAARRAGRAGRAGQQAS